MECKEKKRFFGFIIMRYNHEKDKKTKNNYPCGVSAFIYGQLVDLGKSFGRNKPINNNF